jgi:hypothetical protein
MAMSDNSHTLTLTLQVKDDGSVVLDTVKKKIEDMGEGGGSALDGLKSKWLQLAGAAGTAYAVVKTIERVGKLPLSNTEKFGFNSVLDDLSRETEAIAKEFPEVLGRHAEILKKLN